MASYKIGTRGSLLAVTQCTLVKNQLEQLSGDKFELVLIKTQGDQITDKPLWQLEGKDFFTKELDEALLKKEVDLVVHSYKDLGSIRPQGIKLAAITERRFAHDILLIPQSNIELLQKWQGEFIVGTSSPRRIANLTPLLKDFLPHGQENSFSIKCETLRGNVNSRIRKLKDGKYHAIVLALAGIERLAHTQDSAAELKELLQGLNYFILPQSVFPSAASQGALGIEICEDRNDKDKLLSIISKLKHERTIEEVHHERKAFKEFGGGCHLAVGIHVKKIADTFLHIHSGEVDGKRIEKKWIDGIKYPQLSKKKLFVGLPLINKPGIIADQFLSKAPRALKVDMAHKHIFVTSRYCLPTLEASKKSSPSGLWAAGTMTAKKLAQAGFWVNGTSDSLGTEDLKAMKESRALQIFDSSIKEDWIVLTHDQSSSDIGQVIGCYSREENSIEQSYEDALKEVGGCYWTSFPQYETFLKRFPFLKDKSHFCGLGKTWQEFQKATTPVYPVAQMQDFYDLAK